MHVVCCTLYAAPCMLHAACLPKQSTGGVQDIVCAPNLRIVVKPDRPVGPPDDRLPARRPERLFQHVVPCCDRLQRRRRALRCAATVRSGCPRADPSASKAAHPGALLQARAHPKTERRGWNGSEPSPGADVGRASPVPVQMWAGMSPVLVQMWAGVSPVPMQMTTWGGPSPRRRCCSGVSPVPVQMWAWGEPSPGPVQMRR
jgi:hypothetical protein